MAVTANKRCLRSMNPVLHRRVFLGGAFSVFVAMAFAPAAHAVNWRFEPSVSASAILTDNVNQSANDPQDALILSATPSFTLRSIGSRKVQATLQYGLTGVKRFGGDQSGDVFHNLNASGKAELIDDFLFIDGAANVSQELISLAGSPADATINSSNRATVGSYSVSPYLKRRFGTFADAEARYTLSGTLFANNVASNLANNAFNASLNSGTRFSDLSWGLHYSYRDVSSSGSGFSDTSYAYERADLSLGYALTRNFRLIGDVGQEKITYNSAIAAANNRDDSFWSGGFGWSPSRRTSIEATVGERFFGHTYNLSAHYRTRESTWTASYVEDVSDISQATLTERTSYLYLCPGANPGDPSQFIQSLFLISPAPGCILVGTQAALIPSLANGLYVSKTLSAGVNWGIRKISYSINAFDIRRIYLLQNNAEDRSLGIVASMNYRLAPLINLYGNLSLTRNEEPAALSHLVLDRVDDLYSFVAGVNRQFDSRLTGALTFRRSWRNSNDPTAVYSEDSLMASVNMRF
jgi:uncharacterized protein (PEP-CTERM system associated)